MVFKKSSIKEQADAVQPETPQHDGEPVSDQSRDGVNAAPTLPADIEVPNPIKDYVAEGGMQSIIKDQENTFKPYRHYSGDSFGRKLPYAPSLVAKANELAKEIWHDYPTYVKVRTPYPVSAATLTDSSNNISVLMENNEQYDSNSVETTINEIFRSSPLFYKPYEGTDIHPATLVKKIRRLERKHLADEIIDDEGREKIIDHILLPANLYGIAHPSYFDLYQPQQKSVIDGILSNDEMLKITNILSLISRVRNILNGYREHIGVTSHELLLPLNFNSLKKSSDPFRLDPSSNPLGDNKTFIHTLDKVHTFLFTIIPWEIQKDFIPERTLQGDQNSLYLNVQKASASLREAAYDYIQNSGKLSLLLEETLNLTEALRLYFQSLNHEINLVFQLLNRLGLSYKTLVKEAEDYFTPTTGLWE